MAQTLTGDESARAMSTQEVEGRSQSMPSSLELMPLNRSWYGISTCSLAVQTIAVTKAPSSFLGSL